MPSQSQANGQRADNEAHDEMLYRINVLLRQNVNRLRLLLRTNHSMFAGRNLTTSRQALLARLSGNGPISDEDYSTLATEVVDQGTFLGVAPSQLTLQHNGQTTNLAAVLESEAHVSIDDMRSVPALIGGAVQRNTGDVTFLRGATIGQAFRGFFRCIQEEGFFAAIGHLFSLIFGGLFGRGGSNDTAPNPLLRCIAACTADDICDDLAHTLPGMSPGMRQEIIDGVRRNVMTEAGFPCGCALDYSLACHWLKYSANAVQRG